MSFLFVAGVVVVPARVAMAAVLDPEAVVGAAIQSTSIAWLTLDHADQTSLTLWELAVLLYRRPSLGIPVEIPRSGLAQSSFWHMAEAAVPMQQALAVEVVEGL
jgi:hypothetical protein